MSTDELKRSRLLIWNLLLFFITFATDNGKNIRQPENYGHTGIRKTVQGRIRAECRSSAHVLLQRHPAGRNRKNTGMLPEIPQAGNGREAGKPQRGRNHLRRREILCRIRSDAAPCPGIRLQQREIQGIGGTCHGLSGRHGPCARREEIPQLRKSGPGRKFQPDGRASFHSGA